MSLTSRQKYALLAMALLWLLSELFPPWYYKEVYHECPAGYGFIKKPPALRPYEEMLTRCIASDLQYETIQVHKDMSQLKEQRLILALITIGGLLIFTEQRTILKIVVGSIAAIVGAVRLILLLIFIQMGLE